MDQVSKFQMLAAHISDQLERWGEDGIYMGPEPMYFILGILHKRAQQPAVDGHQLIEEIYEQMSLNYSVGFDFDEFYERMRNERERTEAYEPSGDDPRDAVDTAARIAAVSSADDKRTFDGPMKLGTETIWPELDGPTTN